MSKGSRGSLDLTGEKIGLLTAEHRTEQRWNMSIVWECRCDCGGTKRVAASYWVKWRDSRRVFSCGCHKDIYDTGSYKSYRKMLSRTRSPEYIHHYGIVTVCDEWDTYKGGCFENFYRDMGDRPEGFSINRIGGANIYSKDTCEWASKTLQSYDTCRRADNSSGKTGVRWRPERNVWMATISKNGKVTRLYHGPSKEEAIMARERAELEMYGFLTKPDQTHVESPE